MPLDRPTRTEILDVVETLLDRDVKPRIDPELGYPLRIAIALLRTLRRELVAADAFAALEADALGALLPDAPFEDASSANRVLCARIRDGALAHDDPELLERLRALTLAKMAIDQPRYPSYLDVRAHGFPSDRIPAPPTNEVPER